MICNIIYPAKQSKKVAHWKLQNITSLLFAMIIQAPAGKSPGLRAHSWTPPQTCWVASVGPEVKMLQKFFLRSLYKSLRIITWALLVSRNKSHFTSLSAVDVRVRSEQWAGKAQRLDAQTLEIRVVFIHMTRQYVPVFQWGPVPMPQLVLCHCFLFASGPPAPATGRDYPTLHQSAPAIFWEWDIQLPFFPSVFTHWKKVIVNLRLRMNQAVLTLSLLTGVQKSNQLLINTCDKINLIFFLKQRGQIKRISLLLPTL